MKMANVLMILATLGASLSAQATTYTELYHCFNHAQLVDGAPIVTIVQDENQQQFLELEGRGFHRYVSLVAERAMIVDGSIFEGTNVEVVEHNGVEIPGEYATVQFKSGLSYKCSPANE